MKIKAWFARIYSNIMCQDLYDKGTRAIKKIEGTKGRGTLKKLKGQGTIEGHFKKGRGTRDIYFPTYGAHPLNLPKTINLLKIVEEK